MSQSELEAYNALPPKDPHDCLTKVLRGNTSNAEQAANDDRLLPPDDIGAEGYGEG
jgi:hypothetical protein